MKNYFRNIISMLATFLCVAMVSAQDTPPYEMVIKGVKVIVQPTANEILVVKTIIKGGVRNYTIDKAGIENLTMTALTECGTKYDTKNQFKDKLDKVNAWISGSADMDFANLTMDCIASDFNQVWKLYSDALLYPAFDNKEYDRIKQDAINFIRTGESDPDNAIEKLNKKVTFAGKDYEKDPAGSISSVEGLTVDNIKNYWKQTFTRSRLCIVVVGNVNRKDIEEKVSQLLQAVPQGAAYKQVNTSYTPTKNSFYADKRDNATNYIMGITSGPASNSPDFDAFRIAMNMFYSKHFLEIRTNNGLSYAPGAWFNQGAMSYATLYVSTTQPDNYVAIARQLLDKIKKEGFSEDELKNMKTEYVTNFYYKQETNSAQANSLAWNEAVRGNWRKSLTLKDDVKKISAKEVNDSFKKYIKNISWVYQGDPSKATPTMFTQPQTPKLPEKKKGF